MHLFSLTVTTTLISRPLIPDHLLKLGPTTTHNLSLTDQLGTKLTTIQGEIDIKVDPVKGSLGGIHAFKVGFQVLAREVGSQSDDFFDSWFR